MTDIAKVHNYIGDLIKAGIQVPPDIVEAINRLLYEERRNG